MRRQAALAVLVVILATTVSPSPASAGGTMLQPVQDRYAGGELATLVGYTQWWEGRRLPAFDAYLRAAGQDGPVRHLPSDVRLGPLRMEHTGNAGYLAVRASITFRVPAHLAPSRYEVMICQDACPGVVGAIFGGEFWVGVGPAYPVQRLWALDDPEIANLAPAAVLAGPGYETTAAAVRAGWAPTDARPGDGRPPFAVGPAPAGAVSPVATSPAAAPTSGPGPSAPVPAGAAAGPWSLLGLVAVLITALMAVVTRRVLSTRRVHVEPGVCAPADHVRSADKASVYSQSTGTP